LQSIFGLQIPQPLLYVGIIAIILLFLGIFAWILQKITRTNSGIEGNNRVRQPRLGIVDTFQLDRQRQLVIIRRDTVEHLLLLGGTNDIVVESNIVRSISSQSQTRETPAVSRVSAPIQTTNSTKPIERTKENSTAEVTFTAEQNPAFQEPITNRTDTLKVISVPQHSELAEIANRFQTASDKQIVAERGDVSKPTSTTIAPTPNAMPTSRIDEHFRSNHLIDEKEIMILTDDTSNRPIEGSEKLQETSSKLVQSKDVGSLNDTLRQLLGRQRDS